MSLRQDQSKFVIKVAELILYAYAQGYELSFGDAWATAGHKENSMHYKRLAIDLNLFKGGEWLSLTEDHKTLGEYWKSLDPMCTWGGDWNDGNHYSYGETT